MNQATVELKILNQNYSINCEVGEEMILRELAIEFNENIEKLKIRHPNTTNERLIVVYALNLLKKFRNLKIANAEAANYLQLVLDKFPDSFE